MRAAAPCCTDHLVAVRDQLAHRGGGQAHPVFVGLDLLGNADLHLSFLLATGPTTQWLAPPQGRQPPPCRPQPETGAPFSRRASPWACRPRRPAVVGHLVLASPHPLPPTDRFRSAWVRGGGLDDGVGGCRPRPAHRGGTRRRRHARLYPGLLDAAFRAHRRRAGEIVKPHGARCTCHLAAEFRLAQRYLQFRKISSVQRRGPHLLRARRRGEHDKIYVHCRRHLPILARYGPSPPALHRRIRKFIAAPPASALVIRPLTSTPLDLPGRKSPSLPHDRPSRSPGGRPDRSAPRTGRDTLDLDIAGMTCASCVGRVERALARVPGVLGAEVNLATRRARIVRVQRQRRRADALAAAVRKAGFDARPAD